MGGEDGKGRGGGGTAYVGCAEHPAALGAELDGDAGEGEVGGGNGGGGGHGKGSGEPGGSRKLT